MEPELIKYIYTEELYSLEAKISDKERLLVAVDASYDQQNELLDKILASINLNRKNAEIRKFESDLEIGKVEFDTIISFGVRIAENPRIKLYSKLNFNGKTVLTADNLQSIANDSSNDLKKKLWNLLKNHFK